MLTLTPAVEEIFSWFYATHELATDNGRVWWRRTSLPTAGGVGDQDGRLMAELEYLEALLNALLRARFSKPKPAGPKQKTT